MAIYTGKRRALQDARKASRDIAKQQRKAEKGEIKRKGRAGIFGKVGGFLATEALTYLAGTALTGLTGGIVNPATLKLLKTLKNSKNLIRLAKAAATGTGMFLGRAGAHQATTGKWDKALPGGMSLKTPGQVDEIKSSSKFGYGRKQASTLSQALADERKSEEDWGTLAGDIAGAGATQFAGESLSSLFKGKGEVGKEGFDKFVDINEPSPWRDIVDAQGTAFPPEGKGPVMGFPWFGGEKKWQLDPDNPFEYNEGGQVPSEEDQLMALIALAQIQQQQETAYSGTPLEEAKQQPTISDMFASQGKTLGGNNTQSLSQMLGR